MSQRQFSTAPMQRYKRLSSHSLKEAEGKIDAILIKSHWTILFINFNAKEAGRKTLSQKPRQANVCQFYTSPHKPQCPCSAVPV